MSNPERGGFNPEGKQTERKTLIKGTMGNKKLEASLHSFAEQTGRAGVDITSPERETVRREWLLQQTETSPELNNEMMYAIRAAQRQLDQMLNAGDKEGTLASIEELKGLINKLEHGVANIQ